MALSRCGLVARRILPFCAPQSSPLRRNHQALARQLFFTGVRASSSFSMGGKDGSASGGAKGGEGTAGETWHRRRQLVVMRQKERSLEQVVNNIIYSNAERAEPLAEDADGQVLSVLVEDEPGVLSRTASLLSGRGFNIKSLSVSPTDLPGLSRMTITVMASGAAIMQVVRQLEGVEEVLAVLPSSRMNSVHREVLLMKMDTQIPEEVPEEEHMVYVHEKRAALMQLADLFKAEIVDVGKNHATIQLVSWPKRIEAFIEIAKPYGIVETARSGVVAMPRGIVVQPSTADADDAVDISLLPPS